jgi:uncharacterized membrane protein YebE (DUF533 family)
MDWVAQRKDGSAAAVVRALTAAVQADGYLDATSEQQQLWVEDARDPEWTASIAELRQRLERSTGI